MSLSFGDYSIEMNTLNIKAKYVNGIRICGRDQWGKKLLHEDFVIDTVNYSNQQQFGLDIKVIGGLNCNCCHNMTIEKSGENADKSTKCGWHSMVELCSSENHLD